MKKTTFLTVRWPYRYPWPVGGPFFLIETFFWSFHMEYAGGGGFAEVIFCSQFLVDGHPFPTIIPLGISDIIAISAGSIGDPSQEVAAFEFDVADLVVTASKNIDGPTAVVVTNGVAALKSLGLRLENSHTGDYIDLVAPASNPYGNQGSIFWQALGSDDTSAGTWANKSSWSSFVFGPPFPQPASGEFPK
jgi:hypothetical protein